MFLVKFELKINRSKRSKLVYSIYFPNQLHTLQFLKALDWQPLPIVKKLVKQKWTEFSLAYNQIPDLIKYKPGEKAVEENNGVFQEQL